MILFRLGFVEGLKKRKDRKLKLKKTDERESSARIFINEHISPPNGDTDIISLQGQK